MGVIVEFCVSTLSLLWGVIRKFYCWLPALVLTPFDLAGTLLGITYSIPAFIIWSLFGVGLFLAVAFTYYEVWQKQTIKILTKAKSELREHAEKGHQTFNASMGVFTTSEPPSEVLDNWRREGYRIVKKYLGKPQANTFQRIIDNQLAHASPNEVSKEGHALNAGIGWVEARSHQITEFDLKR